MADIETLTVALDAANREVEEAWNTSSAAWATYMAASDHWQQAHQRATEAYDALMAAYQEASDAT